MFGALRKLQGWWIEAISLPVLISASLLISTELYGQTPTPTKTSDKPKTQSQSNKKPSAADQRGTEQSPLIIKVIPTPNTDEKAEPDGKAHEEKATTERWLIGLTGLLVLFTAILALYTAKLWSATDKLVKGAQDTARRQLRAYVFVDRAEITSIDSGDAPIATIVIKNSGQTPAYGLTQVGGIAIGESFDTLTHPIGPHGISKTSLSPGGITQHFNSAPGPLSTEEKSVLHAGTKTLWVYGEVHYKDAFGMERFTNYRFMIGGHAGVRSNRMAICEEGNEAN